jgi:thiamine biosynthesis lipoprotein
MRPPHCTKILFVLTLSFLAAATARGQERFEFSQPHMGTTFRIVLYASATEAARKAADAAFARIAALDGIMSDYKSDSELMRLTDRAGTGPVPVSNDLFAVLDHAQKIAQATDGAFDVTVGPYVQLWRRARRQVELPRPAQLAAARDRVGYRHLQLDRAGRTVTLTQPGMRLDLGGIAKGYALDAALAELKRHGITSALAVGGGDVVAGARPPNAAGWIIDVLPFRADGPIEERLCLEHAAVSTSGEREQFVTIQGVRYSHIVDPRTGLGLTGRNQATVVAPCGVLSDAWATACSVLGVDDAAAKLPTTENVQARLSTERNGKVETITTPGWHRRLQPAPK